MDTISVQLNGEIRDKYNPEGKSICIEITNTPSIQEVISSLGIIETKIIAVVNNKPLPLNTHLKPGDELSIFPFPMGG